MASRDIDILLSAFDRRPAIDELFRSASPEDLSRWANALGELSQHLSSPTKLIEIYSKRSMRSLLVPMSRRVV